ncbi:Hypothetical predicted protein [Mytilus galloprovincialis]|uniref:Uncharacterized protein n=1 Tax=Mytilus galloprovincialis TaxID=29158 RepID=A0A8B6FAI0_MYTGA|nr:Hypothetical predicted protein [Mytilus galloprovincialis]
MTRHLREHAFGDHVSPMFESSFGREVMHNQGFHQFRGHMVILLARWLTGQENITYTEFVSWLQQRAAIPKCCKIQGVDMPPMRAVCMDMNWQNSVYCLHPITSPSSRLILEGEFQILPGGRARRGSVHNQSASDRGKLIALALWMSHQGTQPLQSVPQREEEERVTPPVEEPVAVATKPDESLGGSSVPQH